MSESDFEDAVTSTNGNRDDKLIQCCDCRQMFTWSIGEQAFYQTKGLTNPPKRCKPCKQEKNKRLDAIEQARATGRRYRIDIKAECARCNKVTTVPFYPSQGRPVYCRACFLEMNAPSASEAGA
jgi:CxxC-x17-CxxC domain-containing protein